MEIQTDSSENESNHDDSNNKKGKISRQKNISSYFEKLPASTSTSTSNTAVDVDSEDDSSNSLANVMTGIFNSEFYKIIKMDGKNLESQCNSCLPIKKVIKGSKQVTTNFIKHLRRKHPDKYLIYEENKKKNQEKNKRPLVETLYPNNKRLKMQIPKNDQKEFDNKIIRFISDTMSPISIVEQKSFKDLLSTFEINVMSRKTASRKIMEMFQNKKELIKMKIDKQNFLCLTADIWSSRRRSFMGVTCHWLNEENFKRESVALSCKRLFGTHDYRKIGDVLNAIMIEFGISPEKIVSTVTDNGSNFVKAFETFGIKVTEYQATDEDSEDFEEIEFFHVEEKDGVTYESEEVDDPILSKHIRCCSHTLNLIVTTDIKNIINGNNQVRTKNMHAINKCGLLWKKAALPKSAEIIQEVLGHSLSAPGITRWNSLYDSLNQILKEKNKLTDLCSKLQIKIFSEAEITYLEEYCDVLHPLAATLDILQGEENAYYGLVLPSLASLWNKLTKLKLETNHRTEGDLLLNGVISNLTRRFEKIFSLTDTHALLASVSHPQFKLRWYPVIESFTEISVEDIKTKLTEACMEFYNSTEKNEENFPSPVKDLFFDFNESHATGTSNFSFTRITSFDKIKLEVLKYIDDTRKNLSMLNDYPMIKQVFIKFNTSLPSSAAVERLFSFATIINAPKRHALSDKNFEMLVLLKSNSEV